MNTMDTEEGDVMRAEFAKAAMTGILANPELGRFLRETSGGALKITGETVANMAVQCGDALLRRLA